MALDLTTYSGLQAAIASYLDRADLTDQIPAFIKLAEAKMNRVLRMREAEAEASLTGVVGSRYINLPTGFNEPLNLWIVRDYGRQDPPPRFVPAELMITSTTQAEPREWTIDGTKVAFERPLDQAYSFTLRYVGSLALSDSVTSNAILADHPDAYLYGALLEAAPFLRDNDLIATYQGKYDLALEEINNEAHRSKALVTLSTEPAMMVGRLYRRSFNIMTGD